MDDPKPVLSEGQANALLAAAAQKLGKSPEALRAQLQSGGIGALTDSLDEAGRERAAALLNDPQALRQALGDPRVQAVLAHLTKGGRRDG